MIRQIQLKLKSRDEVTIYTRKRFNSDLKYMELSVWGDYEGRGGTSTLEIQELDHLIISLVEIRKDLV